MATDYVYVGEELALAAQAVRWKRYFAGLLAPYVGGRVLEVGAGMGETMRSLWHPGVTAWTSVEPDARLAARIPGVALPGGMRPQVIVGDVGGVPAGSAFDSIVYIDVLEHIAADREELARAARLLAPGGRLVVLSPAYQALYSEFDRGLGHERRYTAGSLSAVFPPGLRRERVFYADSVGALLSLGNRVLLHRALPTRGQILFWDRVVIPISRVLDPVLGRRVGRSVIAVFRRP